MVGVLARPVTPDSSRWARTRLLGAAMTLAFAGCAEDSEPRATDLRGSTMGTRWHVRAVLRPEQDGATITARVQGVLDGVDQAMSTWISDSEVERFNAATLEADEWFAVSEDTVQVVQLALDWNERSGGAFDITVGPLVQLWGFGSSDPLESAPEEAALRAALELVGSAALRTREDPPALQRRALRRIDLSAIAKGYAVDLLVECLRRAEVPAAMVEVGGEVRCFGRRTDGSSWRVGIEKPLPDERSAERVVELDDRALASSGDYRNFRDLDGRRVSHTIDPRTGDCVEHDLAGVSVSSERCADADALCTALMVMGLERGYPWAVDRSIAARFVQRTESGFETRCTPRFRDLHGEE